MTAPTTELLQRSSTGALTPLAWKPRGELRLADWKKAGRQLGSIGRACQWWIGDWLNYGAARYGEKYDEAVDVTGYDVQSLMNMSYVAGRVEISRRRETLTYSHHAEVAPFEPAGQVAWLKRAEQEQWPVRRLREELQRGLPRSGEPSGSTAPARRSTAAPVAGGGRGEVERHMATLTVRREGSRAEFDQALAGAVEAVKALGFTVTVG